MADITITLDSTQWGLIDELIESAISDTNDGLNKPIKAETELSDRLYMYDVREFRAKMLQGILTPQSR